MSKRQDNRVGRHANVRVELRSGERGDREREFKKMFSAFKKEVALAGVMRDFRSHENFESKSRKRRRKMREAQLVRERGNVKEVPADKR